MRGVPKTESILRPCTSACSATTETDRCLELGNWKMPCKICENDYMKSTRAAAEHRTRRRQMRQVMSTMSPMLHYSLRIVQQLIQPYDLMQSSTRSYPTRNEAGDWVLRELTQRQFLDNFFPKSCPQCTFIHPSNVLFSPPVAQSHRTLYLAILAASAASR